MGASSIPFEIKKCPWSKLGATRDSIYKLIIQLQLLFSGSSPRHEQRARLFSRPRRDDHCLCTSQFVSDIRYIPFVVTDRLCRSTRPNLQ